MFDGVHPVLLRMSRSVTVITVREVISNLSINLNGFSDTDKLSFIISNPLILINSKGECQKLSLNF